MTKLDTLMNKVKAIHDLQLKTSNNEINKLCCIIATRLKALIEEIINQDPDKLIHQIPYKKFDKRLDCLYVLLDDIGLQCIVKTDKYLDMCAYYSPDLVATIVKYQLGEYYKEYDITIDKVVTTGFNLRVKPKTTPKPISFLEFIKRLFLAPREIRY